jgi:hypothetical protein
MRCTPNDKRRYQNVDQQVLDYPVGVHYTVVIATIFILHHKLVGRLEGGKTDGQVTNTD